MRLTPFAEGDLRWVFPDLLEQDEVRGLMERADEQKRQLHQVLGHQPVPPGCGLEYTRFNERADLQAHAETTDAEFIAELDSVPAYATRGSDAYGPPWEVTAKIGLWCSAPLYCGTHTIEEFNPSGEESATPLAAARDFLAATTWLLEHARAVPVSSWKERDPGCYRRPADYIR